ncbi:hypothetical protein [Leucobacter sp. M11]|uniref:hypothetical protein n=1 Tax=Leucobacter sp. M11 TaxID=2993565 RepID=UPI002D7F8ABE|nr:hypothetical protein [Leucobacter sp. M11]MEB4615238.1 hypothetical protein [Leucobacter sp. M11]
MEHTPYTEDELRDALDRYRTALEDAVEAGGADRDRAETLAAAREILDEDDVDAHRLITELAAGEYGDQVWRLEEELLDDE